MSQLMMGQTFSGPSAQELLQRVKSSLGPDAILLSTRTIRPTAPDGRQMIEIVAAPGDGRARGRETKAKPEVRSKDAELAETLERRWVRAGVAPTFARTLARAIEESLPAFLARGGRPGDVRQRVVDVIGREIRFTGPLSSAVEDVHVFVGPTGVGKTTTICKLAHDLVDREGARVGLIYADVEVPGATARLRHTAEELGAELRVASTAEELDAAMKELRKADFILIDTEGRSSWEDQRHAALATKFAPFGARARVTLCLAAGTKLSDLHAHAHAFRGIEPAQLVVTKVDDAAELGSALNPAAVMALPLAYLTTGPSIPADIALATAADLALLLEAEGDA